MPPKPQDSFDIARQAWIIQNNRILDLEKRIELLEKASSMEAPEEFVPPEIEPEEPIEAEVVEVKDTKGASPFDPRLKIKKQILQQAVEQATPPPPKKKLKLNKWTWVLIIVVILVIYLYIANSLGWTCAFTR